MMGPEEFAGLADVSRETLEKFQIYLELLKKWRSSHNLVGVSTLADPWRRHFLDSAQVLMRWREEGPARAAQSWLDLGSGAGFPGLVLAIMGAGEVHLVESNGKKCAFLRQVIRSTGAKARVHQGRIGDIDLLPVDVITSRALASISRILTLGEKFCGSDTEYWLLKGAAAQRELTEARKYWKVDWRFFQSVTDDFGAVLRLRECKRVDQA
ncbi:MAG: 16S rRNA (guanine(527)-N(7))-methyltransferase RsmG [Proteobacteria bacterium]|nr:16S rRNA (guanine(527)-N(7))-methyltransferase RsmG [Pseudomonadota bacterium]